MKISSITFCFHRWMLQVLGVAILFSAWGGCYFARPSARSSQMTLHDIHHMNILVAGSWLSWKEKRIYNGNRHSRGLTSLPSSQEYLGMNQKTLFALILVSITKVGASRKGCSSWSGFWGESLPEETANACPGNSLLPEATFLIIKWQVPLKLWIALQLVLLSKSREENTVKEKPQLNWKCISRELVMNSSCTRI